ncbi:sulfite exporter TauE/SafE family protein [uncultured Clostridium sp.]|uniref:sulfite exporter TauE/SafE family protein n=1 Tax=uncultured Clostridium sp. TaxID=59620 RepID=UPI002627DD82|nr:sulfite exporter TauE/SafE family protein [uncultured Clostridium sp.]
MDFEQILLFALIIMCTYFIEGLIGFGGTIMALPLASMVVGIKITVPVLTIVVLIASIVIAIRDFKHIDKKQLIKITGFMAAGLPIGMILFSVLPERPLKVALGIFMVIIGAKGIYDSTEKRQAELKSKENIETSKIAKIIENITLFAGGIVHGAFTCGGPFVVMYATKNIKDKSSFRATLCALWAALNALMLSINVFKGEITGEIMKLSGITMIFVMVAIYVSNIVHKKINGDSFNKFVYIALCISGVLMAK